MKHAEKCPVCDGSGKYEPNVTAVPCPQQCHGCGGRGWVEVGNNFDSLPQPIYHEEPWPRPNRHYYYDDGHWAYMKTEIGNE